MKAAPPVLLLDTCTSPLTFPPPPLEQTLALYPPRRAPPPTFWGNPHVPLTPRLVGASGDECRALGTCEGRGMAVEIRQTGLTG